MHVNVIILLNVDIISLLQIVLVLYQRTSTKHTY